MFLGGILSRISTAGAVSKAVWSENPARITTDLHAGFLAFDFPIALSRWSLILSPLVTTLSPLTPLSCVVALLSG
jgi:hypothetical protein